MTTQDTNELAPLADRFEIIGELGGGGDARTYLARRRETGEDVLVRVMRAPGGDQGNALSHLATDANRLADRTHRNVVPVLEAQWLGNDALAVVTARVPYPTLEDLLVRRDEAFSCPRVAAILREINAAIEWARAEHIVHRAVEPSSVHVEPGSDRVLLAFCLRALPRADMPGAQDDARTIATLARAMLTRSVADPERDRLPLRELRPGLPDRLVDQTDAILALTPRDEVPDVSEYIAVVAMSDFLKRAETECAVTTARLLEEERVARETIEAEREATARAAAEQARLFQLERDEFAKEREKMLAELARQREALDRERDLLARERLEHEQDRERFNTEREEHRRWADDVEKAFAAQAAAYEAQSRELREARETAAMLLARTEEMEARQVAMAAMAAVEPAAEDPGVAPPPSSVTSEVGAGATSARPVAMPPRPRRHRVRPGWVRSLSHRAAIAWERRPGWNRKWNVPAAATVLLLLLVVSAVAIARTRDSGDGRAAIPPVATSPAGSVVDSAAGGLGAPEPATSRSGSVGIPEDFARSVTRARESGVPGDFVSGVRQRLATREEVPSTEAVPFRPRLRPPVRGDTEAGATQQAPSPPAAATRPTAPPAPARDTLMGPPMPAEAAPVRGSARPDSVRRDTARSRPDTLRPPTDTLPGPA